jgi:actin-related protein 2
VITPEEQEHAVFVGGAVLADLMKDNKDFWISKEEWTTLGKKKALEKLTSKKN